MIQVTVTVTVTVTARSPSQAWTESHRVRPASGRGGPAGGTVRVAVTRAGPPPGC
jgi:hypothetical protein